VRKSRLILTLNYSLKKNEPSEKGVKGKTGAGKPLVQESILLDVVKSAWANSTEGPRAVW